LRYIQFIRIVRIKIHHCKRIVHHSSCYVVAWFELDEEGYELHFIGNRPMVDIEAAEMASIWVQLQAAQKMLDVYFKACEGSEMYEVNY